MWRGYAPGSLEWSLIVFAKAFDNLAEECRYYATAYEQAADAAAQFFQGLAPLVEMFLDYVILAVIASKVSLATLKTGIGLVAGLAVAAFYINRAIKVAQEAYDHLQRFTATVDILAAAQMAYQARQTWKMPELIDGPRFVVVEHD